MRTLLVFAVGLLIGAAGFHAYYRSLDDAARCGWDHPLDDGGKRRCGAGEVGGYSKRARGQLNQLIDNVSG
jgi:hypothetical protein